MTHDDVEENVRIQIAAFADLAARQHEAEHPVTDTMRERARSRHRHFIEHDPQGSWTAEVDGQIAGCAMALRREGLWGLSLLVVDPARQSSGAGRMLIDAALTYAQDCDRAIILSSTDARAIRLYSTSGFSLFPQMAAVGVPDVGRRPAAVSRVREGGPDDWELANAVDRGVRGSGRAPDHAYICGSAEMYVVDDSEGRGYAYLRDSEIYLLSASDEKTASALLWRCFVRADEKGLAAHVEHMTAEQQWAIRACFDARLAVSPGGPVFWRGMTPPPSYIPSGAFL